MFIFSKYFLLKAHSSFNELGLHVKSTDAIKPDVLLTSTIKTLNHTDGLRDGIIVMRSFRFLNEKYNKICSKISKYAEFWDALPYGKKELVSLVSGEDGRVTFFITNAFYLDEKTYAASSFVFGDNCVFPINYQNGQYFFGDKEHFYSLRFSNLSSNKMLLLDRSGNKKCTISSKGTSGGICLENNNTDWDVILYEAGIGIYKKSYIDSLEKNEPNPDEMNAFIEWDMLDDKSGYSLAKLHIFAPIFDYEMFLLFALSAMLLFSSKIENIKKISSSLNLLLASSARNASFHR